MKCTPIEFTNRDDLPIRADLHLPAGDGPHPLVLVAHGFKGFKDWGFFPSLADGLARAGVAALRFNFARNGVGEDPTSFDRLDLFQENSISRELADLEDLMDRLPGHPGLESTDTDRLGLFGHSRGGAAAILFAGREPRVRSLVTWAAVAEFGRFFPAEVLDDWRAEGVFHIENARTKQQMPLGMDLHCDLTERREELDVRSAEAGLRIPHLIVHGAADTSVPVTDGRAIYEASGGSAEILTIDGADHTMGAVHPFAGTTEHLDLAVNATAERFSSTL